MDRSLEFSVMFSDVGWKHKADVGPGVFCFVQ